MHGYETKELREAHVSALVDEKQGAQARLAHAEQELADGAEGAQRAYHEGVAEGAREVIAAVDVQLREFGHSARTRRAAASKSAKTKRDAASKR